MAGGDARSRCGTGWIGDDPGLVLDYSAAGYPLTIAAMPSDSPSDLVLQVEHEGGGHETTLYCGDDELFSINPAVTIRDAISGTYRIWIGVYDRAVGKVPAQVVVSEYLDPAIYASEFDFWESATAETEPVTWELVAGFRGDPRTLPVVAGGSENVGGDCGFVAADPSLVIDYTPHEFVLAFMTLGDGIDTTLQVVDPNGITRCNDDMGFEGLDEAVTFEVPVAGRYKVYPGTHSAGDVSAFAEIAVTDRKSDNQKLIRRAEHPASRTSQYGRIQLYHVAGGMDRVPIATHRLSQLYWSTSCLRCERGHEPL